MRLRYRHIIYGYFIMLGGLEDDMDIAEKLGLDPLRYSEILLDHGAHYVPENDVYVAGHYFNSIELTEAAMEAIEPFLILATLTQ